jgi:hypothetical protein
MHMRLFIAALLLSATGLAVAQAYRWVDENGVVHYSDRPIEGAEEIILPQSSGPSSPAVPRRSVSRGEATSVDDQPADAYNTLDITSPAPEETLWNIEGTLNVTMNLEPGLRSGHRIRVYFDGEERMVFGTTFQIPEVYRGVHNIQAEVLDRGGRVMIRSTTNRFYVQQTTIINNRPGPAPR